MNKNGVIKMKQRKIKVLLKVENRRLPEEKKWKIK
jgi:hypothetical protein